jgi:hypothetical protein
MKLHDDIKGAVVGFTILLSKGLIEDDRWDWDVEKCNWKDYQESFTDPTHLRTTLSIFVNNLEVDETGKVLNYEDARFRAFQYFRPYFDRNCPRVEFEDWEYEEPYFLDWES